jgi:hypothetical protein
MAWVYILRGASERHYFGATDHLNQRIREHQRGSNHTTRPLRRSDTSARFSRGRVDGRGPRSRKTSQKDEESSKGNPVFKLERLEQPPKLPGLAAGSSPAQPTFFKQ